MAVVEVPLTPNPQTFSMWLGSNQYRMRLLYNDVDAGGWVLDIGTMDNVLLIGGIPLVTGCDLLGQFRYMNFGGGLFVTTDSGAGEVPTYTGLGTTSHLYFADYVV